MTQNRNEQIPKIYRDLRAKYHGVGMGYGPETEDGSGYLFLMKLFTEKEAEVVIKMMYQWQTPAQYAKLYGLDEKEVSDMFYDMSKRGKMYRKKAEDGSYVYQPLAPVHGLWETNVDKFTPEFAGDFLTMSAQNDFPLVAPDLVYPFERSMPIGKEVLAEGETLQEYDDVELYIKNSTARNIWTCACRETFRKGGMRFPDGSEWNGPGTIETCMVLNDMAQYYNENGWGRQLTVEEALELAKENYKHGYVPQAYNSKKAEVICFCDGKVCPILNARKLVPYKLENWNNYIVKQDENKCNKCGKCISACPIGIITQTDEGETVTDLEKCLGCGQCVTKCEPGARKIYQKGNLIPPDDMIENQELQIQWRGLIRKFDPLKPENE